MAYKVVFSPDVYRQIDAAAEYYKNEASAKVARAFAEDLKQTLERIKRVLYFRTYYGEFRGKMMKKFPFIVFYKIDETTKIIIVKAVFHTAQSTEKYPM